MFGGIDLFILDSNYSNFETATCRFCGKYEESSSFGVLEDLRQGGCNMESLDRQCGRKRRNFGVSLNNASDIQTKLHCATPVSPNFGLQGSPILCRALGLEIGQCKAFN